MEFLVEIKNQEEGQLKVMKTREFFIVEAEVHFIIDTEIRCDETYVFPDVHLLLNAKNEQMRSIKDIFRKESKSETLIMTFTPEKLSIGGVVQKNATYEL